MSQPNQGSAGKPNVSAPVAKKDHPSPKAPASGGIVAPASKPGSGTKGKGQSF